MCQTSTHLTKLSLMTGTSNISCAIATLTTSISCSMLTPVEVVVQGLLILPQAARNQGRRRERERFVCHLKHQENSFICEYKVPRSRPPFPRNQRLAVEQEYKENGEGCYILEAQDSEGQWWCFDSLVLRLSPLRKGRAWGG